MKTLNDLIKKYNRPGPRYTSYPPVPFWKNAPQQEEWIKHIKSSYDSEQGIDLYVHVPYCESLCYYCGCSRIITKDHSVEDSYLKWLIREWELYQEKLGFLPKVNSLHFGGGTPTFLSPDNLLILLKSLLKSKTSTFIGSIEIDPRTCTQAHLKVLESNGIKRVSLGIQDFDPEVQKAIHRNQTVNMVKGLLEQIRSHQIDSINFDLIYGLPKQNVQSIKDTMTIVAQMRPDLIAFYSYAHLPEKIKNQRLINEKDLPTPELKHELYETGKELLKKHGYEDIGMDHFALPNSFLFKAKKEKRLHRNFMGYVDKKSPVLLGLGPTSISDSSKSFVQNLKEVKAYGEAVDSGNLPLSTGHTHSEQDLLIQKMILQIMCEDELTLPPLSQIPYASAVTEDLKNYANDGVLEINGNNLKILPLGKSFIRNVAMAFDFHLREQKSQTKFSQTI